jgi:hypothetical protein
MALTSTLNGNAPGVLFLCGVSSADSERFHVHAQSNTWNGHFSLPVGPAVGRRVTQTPVSIFH